MGSGWGGGVPDQVMVSAVVPQAAQVAQRGRRKHGPSYAPQNRLAARRRSQRLDPGA